MHVITSISITESERKVDVKEVSGPSDVDKPDVINHVRRVTSTGHASQGHSKK